MKLIYHPDAERELITSAQYYESRVKGLGTQFLNAVDLDIAVIRKAPQRWPVLEDDIRRFPLHRFPFEIYYQVLSGRIQILAIKHCSRDPDYWRYRASGR